MRLRLLVAAVAAVLASAPPASTQMPGGLPACAQLSQGDAARLWEQRKGKGRCEIHCEGCGCKGGPGYRGPNGRCVGYTNLIAVCGPAPHAKCVRECRPVVGGCPARPTLPPPELTSAEWPAAVFVDAAPVQPLKNLTLK